MADYDEPREPRLTPHFPCTSLTPSSKCPHKRPYRRGSSFVCMVCYISGKDHLRALKRNPRTDPKPEPKVETKEKPKTRKEKRAAKQAAARLESLRGRAESMLGLL